VSAIRFACPGSGTVLTACGADSSPRTQISSTPIGGRYLTQALRKVIRTNLTGSHLVRGGSSQGDRFLTPLQLCTTPVQAGGTRAPNVPGQRTNPVNAPHRVERMLDVCLLRAEARKVVPLPLRDAPDELIEDLSR
jgi:hypothetical protein